MSSNNHTKLKTLHLRIYFYFKTFIFRMTTLISRQSVVHLMSGEPKEKEIRRCFLLVGSIWKRKEFLGSI